MNDKFTFTVFLPVDRDEPEVEISFAGNQFALVTVSSGRYVVLFFGASDNNFEIPIDESIEALQYARKRLDRLFYGDNLNHSSI